MNDQHLIDLFGQLAQQQHNLQTLVLTLVSGFATLIIGSTWLWNIYVARKQIEEKVVEETTKAKDEIMSESQTVIDSLYTKTKEKIEKRFLYNEAELARNFALSCEQVKYHSIALDWWFDALEKYLSFSPQSSSARTPINAILELFDNSKVSAKDFSNDVNIDRAKRATKLIPNILGEEREKISGHIKRLQKDAAK